MNPNPWWKESVIYQIYPRSFCDANGDGIGDIKGIISKLDYLKNLGIDILWVSPIFKSPNADNGYDIADYEEIMETFGTMTDFEALLDGVHQRGMKIILDLVVNHSSDEHFWFQEAKKSKDNPYRDYYIWRDEPNDWISFFSGSAWDLDPETKQYFLHLFVKKQPDLNWENPKLRQEIYKMMRFWLDKGVDGFRMDVIPLLSKDTTFANYPPERKNDLTYYANGLRIHEFLQEMNQEVMQHYDCLTVGEGFGVSAKQANLYVGEDRKELNMIYHFDHAVPRDEICFIEPKPELTLVELKKIFSTWDKAIDSTGWQNTYFGNHDNPRMLSRFGNTDKYRVESAKMLATILMTLRGTPSIYQGDEIGMSNCHFEDVAEFDDVQVKNAYQSLVNEKGYDKNIFLQSANKIARDHARTPFQWNNKAQAGFSENAETWLKINPNYTEINAQNAIADDNSIWHHYKKLIQLRKEYKTLITGNFTDLLPTHQQIYAYTRETEKVHFLVLANISTECVEVDIPIKVTNVKNLISNYNDNECTKDNKFDLRPFEAVIYSFSIK